ncbi:MULTISPECIES: glycosyltransferase family 2 protein [Corallincola]|uniref:Glycosyltransferase family 2 protein n=2 Tax=Corallincola TaxID=1775176 RepID=A0ABY1WPJ9_9GAMM|nr:MULTISPECIES: glycosyltransferase family 2 protein [Corallincola]TAA46013.1 glycosyltransferase family 2 protein [Corallincola spongiicola]TCI04123.1 glycosyltransferase family 2 protein [Corallincola luteus]
MSERATLAVAMITKNAGPRFAEALASVSWADQVVILDSGSTDDTLEIAKAAGAVVHASKAWPGFGPQRQAAQKLVTCDWLLWLDSDEVVTKELQHSINQLLTNADPNYAYSINRLTDFFGRFIRHSGWYPDRVVRLYATNRFHYDDALVHEKVLVSKDKVRPLSGDLLHYTADDFHDYMAKSLRYSNDWAKQKHAKGKRTTVVGILGHSLASFLKKYLIQRGFLDGKHGLLLAFQSSHYVFNKYLALWILNRQD